MVTPGPADEDEAVEDEATEDAAEDAAEEPPLDAVLDAALDVEPDVIKGGVDIASSWPPQPLRQAQTMAVTKRPARRFGTRVAAWCGVYSFGIYVSSLLVLARRWRRVISRQASLFKVIV
jgi:hypothetical protein